LPVNVWDTAEEGEEQKRMKRKRVKMRLVMLSLFPLFFCIGIRALLYDEPEGSSEEPSLNPSSPTYSQIPIGAENRGLREARKLFSQTRVPYTFLLRPSTGSEMKPRGRHAI